jgi:hypothetical protein
MLADRKRDSDSKLDNTAGQLGEQERYRRNSCLKAKERQRVIIGVRGEFAASSLQTRYAVPALAHQSIVTRE